jgi:hypothetical protein
MDLVNDSFSDQLDVKVYGKKSTTTVAYLPEGEETPISVDVEVSQMAVADVNRLTKLKIGDIELEGSVQGVGTTILTDPAQKLGFFGATPITRPAKEMPLCDALVALGLIEDGTTISFDDGISLTEGLVLASGADITFDDETVIDSFGDAAVTGKLLTGFTSGAGTVAATDTILAAMNKLDGNVALKMATAAFTDAAVTAKLLTGYAKGAGTVAATDSILAAIQKRDGNAMASVATVTRTDASLAAAIVLANELRTTLVAHADSTGGAGAHPVADTVNFESMPAVASSLASLITLITYQLTSYAAHDLDAKGATPTYHAAQYAGSDLASVVAPTTLAECFTRLADLKAKYNVHDGDDDAHTEDDLFQIAGDLYACTVGSDDYIVAITQTPDAVTVTIPTARMAAGRVLIVKDESGAANTHNITIATEGAEKIDGADTNVISADYGKVTLYSDGSHWFTV